MGKNMANYRKGSKRYKLAMLKAAAAMKMLRWKLSMLKKGDKHAQKYAEEKVMNKANALSRALMNAKQKISTMRNTLLKDKKYRKDSKKFRAATKKLSTLNKLLKWKLKHA